MLFFIHDFKIILYFNLNNGMYDKTKKRYLLMLTNNVEIYM